MKSPEGVSLYQQSATRSNTRCANARKISRRPARSLPTPSSGAKFARICLGIVRSRITPAVYCDLEEATLDMWWEAEPARVKIDVDW